MRTMMLVLVVLGAGCAAMAADNRPATVTVPETTPEQRLGIAWKGRPALDMEAHPVFSMMGPQRQDLSDGSTIVHHVRCVGWKDDDKVTAINWGSGIMTATNQNGAQGQTCCDRQFLIRAGVVEQYRQVPMGGTCNAEARFYPDGQRPAGL